MLVKGDYMYISNRYQRHGYQAANGRLEICSKYSVKYQNTKHSHQEICLTVQFRQNWKKSPNHAHIKHAYEVVVVSFISDRIQQWYRNRKTFCKYQYSHDIETLLHSAGGHQGSRKAHQADNQVLYIYSWNSLCRLLSICCHWFDVMLS